MDPMFTLEFIAGYHTMYLQIFLPKDAKSETLMVPGILDKRCSTCHLCQGQTPGGNKRLPSVSQLRNSSVPCTFFLCNKSRRRHFLDNCSL
jgi:hypothetical protein